MILNWIFPGNRKNLTILTLFFEFSSPDHFFITFLISLVFPVSFQQSHHLFLYFLFILNTKSRLIPDLALEMSGWKCYSWSDLHALQSDRWQEHTTSANRWLMMWCWPALLTRFPALRETSKAAGISVALWQAHRWVWLFSPYVHSIEVAISMFMEHIYLYVCIWGNVQNHMHELLHVSVCIRAPHIQIAWFLWVAESIIIQLLYSK